jgi:anaerobic selenocysteine-containing dehydrogenase
VSGEGELVEVSVAEMVEVSVAEMAVPQPAPELWEWDGDVPDVEVPARDAYALRLVVGRRLYDNGRMVSEADALARVRKPFPLRINPHDAAGLGVETGAQVRVTSGRGSRELTIEIDAGVPAGIAQLEFSADGSGAAELIDANASVTDLRAETVR